MAALGFAPAARASVAVLLEQPYGKLGLFDTAGHSAIYLDHVCAETPVKLRPCRADELGVVISRYDGIQGYDWVATPLMAYLYAVDSAGEIPDVVDKVDVAAMRERYRRAHLESLAPDLPDGKAPEGNWYELAGAAYDRTIYGFSVPTTDEQDANLIAELNDSKNVSRYNGFFVNCADFTRVILDRIYPHAVRRNYVADLGMTSPKSVARGLAHYAAKHKNVPMRVFVVPQVKGSLPRSHPAQDLAEGILKRYGLPLVAFMPETTAVVFVAYVGQGRFSMPKDATVMELRPPVMMPLAEGSVGMEPVSEPVATGGVVASRSAGMSQTAALVRTAGGSY